VKPDLTIVGPCPGHRQADETATDRRLAVDMPSIFPDEFEANAESPEGPGPCLIHDPGEVSDEAYPHRRTEGSERIPMARALSADPRDPDIVRAWALARTVRSGKAPGT
jgi:hypothetical protein